MDTERKISKKNGILGVNGGLTMGTNKFKQQMKRRLDEIKKDKIIRKTVEANGDNTLDAVRTG